MQPEEEKELVEACIRNDRLAQKKLYDRYVRVMMAVCLRYVGDEDSAQDVLQEAFVKVFTSLASFTDSGTLEGWIRRIVVNTALETLRKGDVMRDTTGIEEAEKIMSADVGVIERLSAEDLMGIISALPVGFRTVFNMYAIEGYSHKEIADILGISEGTSRSQYNRARNLIQKKIQEMQ